MLVPVSQILTSLSAPFQYQFVSYLALSFSERGQGDNYKSEENFKLLSGVMKVDH
jgi:hypothetical protein